MKQDTDTTRAESPQTISYEFPKIEFGDDPQFIPDGASDWETQEIRRHWRSAVQDIDNAISILAGLRNRLMSENPPYESDGTNPRQYAFDIAFRVAAIVGLVNSVIHRQAMARPAEGNMIVELPIKHADDFIARYGEAEEAPVAFRVAAVLAEAKDHLTP